MKITCHVFIPGQDPAASPSPDWPVPSTSKTLPVCTWTRGRHYCYFSLNLIQEHQGHRVVISKKAFREQCLPGNDHDIRASMCAYLVTFPAYSPQLPLLLSLAWTESILKLLGWRRWRRRVSSSAMLYVARWPFFFTRSARYMKTPRRIVVLTDRMRQRGIVVQVVGQ